MYVCTYLPPSSIICSREKVVLPLSIARKFSNPKVPPPLHIFFFFFNRKLESMMHLLTYHRIVRIQLIHGNSMGTTDKNKLQIFRINHCNRWFTFRCV